MAIFVPEFANWQEAFEKALKQISEYSPREIITDGKIHRFSVNGKRSNTSGWYVIYQDDLVAGCVGNWATGEKSNWYYSDRMVGTIERQELAEKWAIARQKADQEKIKANVDAAVLANQKWNNELTEAMDDHDYLVSKGIRAYGIKTGKERLYVPLLDETHSIVSLQSIDTKGQKLFMENSRVKGCYFLIGKPKAHVYVAEGYATAATIHEATGEAVLVTFNASNIIPALDSFKALNPYLPLIMCADNDEIGLKYASEAGDKFGCAVLKPVFADTDMINGKKATDFNDLHQLKGIKVVKDIIVGKEDKTPVRFKFMSIGDLEALPPVNWVVDKVFPEKSFGIIYGAPKKGKTFVALDIALSVAAGLPWQGHDTNQGSVLYIAGEGVGGLRKRVKAWMHKYGNNDYADMPFYILPEAVNMMQDQDIGELLASIKQFGHDFKLIFIDTVARALIGGDENSSKEVGLFVKNCDVVKNVTGASVIGIHHAGKDESKGMRGSSALLGGVDTVLRVNKEENLVSITCEDQKDDEPFDDIVLKAELINFGISGSSLVLVPTSQTFDKSQKLSPTERLAYQYLCDCYTDEKIRGMTAVPEDLWRQECYRRELTIGDLRQKSAGFSTAAKRLREKGKIIIEDGMVLLLESLSKINVESDQNSDF